MDKIALLFSNYVLNVGLVSWVAAQILKTIFYAVLERKFKPERLFGAGGMPSAHSATVCGITVALSNTVGYDSPIFALSFVFAMVVMYDAMGVRRQAGEQAKAINAVISMFKNKDKTLSSRDFRVKKENLKEFVGHTPLEVLGGAMLGIIIALLMGV